MPKIPNVYRDERCGTWYYVASLGTDADGNRVRVKRRGFATQAECKAAYGAFMAENRRGSRSTGGASGPRPTPRGRP